VNTPRTASKNGGNDKKAAHPKMEIEDGAKSAAGLQQTNQTRWGNAEHQKWEAGWCRVCDCFRRKGSKKMENARRSQH
jgi:hypothetical protein